MFITSDRNQKSSYVSLTNKDLKNFQDWVATNFANQKKLYNHQSRIVADSVAKYVVIENIDERKALVGDSLTSELMRDARKECRNFFSKVQNNIDSTIHLFSNPSDRFLELSYQSLPCKHNMIYTDLAAYSFWRWGVLYSATRNGDTDSENVHECAQCKMENLLKKRNWRLDILEPLIILQWG